MYLPWETGSRLVANAVRNRRSNPWLHQALCPRTTYIRGGCRPFATANSFMVIWRLSTKINCGSSGCIRDCANARQQREVASTLRQAGSICSTASLGRFRNSARKAFHPSDAGFIRVQNQRCLLGLFSFSPSKNNPLPKCCYLSGHNANFGPFSEHPEPVPKQVPLRFRFGTQKRIPITTSQSQPKRKGPEKGYQKRVRGNCRQGPQMVQNTMTAFHTDTAPTLVSHRPNAGAFQKASTVRRRPKL